MLDPRGWHLSASEYSRKEKEKSHFIVYNSYLKHFLFISNEVRGLFNYRIDLDLSGWQINSMTGLKSLSRLN